MKPTDNNAEPQSSPEEQERKARELYDTITTSIHQMLSTASGEWGSAEDGATFAAVYAGFLASKLVEHGVLTLDQLRPIFAPWAPIEQVLKLGGKLRKHSATPVQSSDVIVPPPRQTSIILPPSAIRPPSAIKPDDKN